MATVTLILGNSGTGKTASLRNMNPEQTLLIQIVKKPVPFKSAGWSYFSPENPKGNIIVRTGKDEIISAMRKTSRQSIIVDDSNYIMTNQFMHKAEEKGYDKFTYMAKDVFDIFNAAAELPDEKRVYFMAHTHQGDDGITRFKTIGKMLDEKVCLEGLVTICLKTVVRDEFFFSTRNNGSDTVKSPIGMFDSDLIPNDLAVVDQQIKAYYSTTVAN